MAAVHGAPDGGAQIDRPHAAHLGRRDPPGHLGAHHGQAHHSAPRNTTSLHAHLLKHRHARHPRTLRSGAGAMAATRHGAAHGHHAPPAPAHGHRPHHQHAEQRSSVGGRRGGEEADGMGKP